MEQLKIAHVFQVSHAFHIGLSGYHWREITFDLLSLSTSAGGEKEEHEEALARGRAPLDTL
jgi:hypothetical protein